MHSDGSCERCPSSGSCQIPRDPVDSRCAKRSPELDGRRRGGLRQHPLGPALEAGGGGGRRNRAGGGTSWEYLYRTYCYPVYAFIRRRGHPRAQAQDLTQDFFLHLVETDTVRHADPLTGRFRNFLLGALEHFLVDAARRAGAQKRGGGCHFVFLDADAAENDYQLAAPAWQTPEPALRGALGGGGRRFGLRAAARGDGGVRQGRALRGVEGFRRRGEKRRPIRRRRMNWGCRWRHSRAPSTGCAPGMRCCCARKWRARSRRVPARWKRRCVSFAPRCERGEKERRRRVWMRAGASCRAGGKRRRAAAVQTLRVADPR